MMQSEIVIISYGYPGKCSRSRGVKKESVEYCEYMKQTPMFFSWMKGFRLNQA